jgi:hypothetical protein
MLWPVDFPLSFPQRVQPAEASPFGPDVFEESTPVCWGAVSALSMHAACASKNPYGTTRFRTQEHSRQSSGWIFTVLTLSNRVYWVTNWFVGESPSHHCIFGNSELHTRFSPYGPSSGSVSNYKRDDDIVNTHCVHCIWDDLFLRLIKIVSKDAVLCSLVYWSCVF